MVATKTTMVCAASAAIAFPAFHEIQTVTEDSVPFYLTQAIWGGVPQSVPLLFNGNAPLFHKGSDALLWNAGTVTHHIPLHRQGLCDNADPFRPNAINAI